MNVCVCMQGGWLRSGRFGELHKKAEKSFSSGSQIQPHRDSSPSFCLLVGRSLCLTGYNIIRFHFMGRDDETVFSQE